MRREALKLLENWKRREDRKPLIITGARQVGKTSGRRYTDYL